MLLLEPKRRGGKAAWSSFTVNTLSCTVKNILLPANFLQNFVEILERLVPKLGAGEGLDNLVHAGVVAASVVRALVALAREMRVIARHHGSSKDDLIKSSLFHGSRLPGIFSLFRLTFQGMREACHSANNSGPFGSGPPNQAVREVVWFGVCIDLAG